MDPATNPEYLQVFQSLLRKDSNISLATLNAPSETGTNLMSVANPAQIRQTVKIIQSNGAQSAAAVTAEAEASGSGVSLLATPKSGNESCIMGYKKRQQTTRPRKSAAVSNDPYYNKWKFLKKYIKNMVFMNAAVCDEVVRHEEKVARVREERRFLLRKLLHYQSQSENQALLGARTLPTSLLKSASDENMTSIKSKTKKKAVPSAEKARQTKELLESLGVKRKPKKSKAGGGKHVVPPIPLDSIGRPIFPLNIGDLTLHSVGEIVADRSGFHTSNSIFPVGYCSTRIYASLQSPDKPALYTCKISDGGKGPMFEIVSEDTSEIFKSRYLSECHSQLLRALNQARGAKLVEPTGKGPEFFGLSHPLVQNLIQSCPGAKKCNGYKWVKFEVNKILSIDSVVTQSEDPSISHEALRSRMFGTGLDQSPSNLRNLLTNPTLDNSPPNT